MVGDPPGEKKNAEHTFEYNCVSTTLGILRASMVDVHIAQFANTLPCDHLMITSLNLNHTAVRTEVEFLDVIGTKEFSSLLFTVTSTNGFYPPPCLEQKWFKTVL